MSYQSRAKHGAFDGHSFRAFLAARFPQATAAHVASLIGEPVSTVEKWLREASKPSVENFGKLMAVFGPALLAAAFTASPEWVEQAVRDEKRRSLDRQIDALERERQSLG